MNKKLFTFIGILLMIYACRPATTETTNELPEETKKDMSGLTYFDLIKWVFEDDGEGYDWQGEILPNDFVQLLTISKEGACGARGCGESLYLSNSSATDTLEVIVSGAYDLEGDVGSIARKYIIPPNGKVSIGCSHLCFEETPYAFEREIVGSKVFMEVAL